MNNLPSDAGKPTIILSPEWRFMDELFSSSTLDRLHARFDVVWGQDGKIPDALYEQALPDAFAVIAAQPQISREDLAGAPKLKAVIEVSGAFPDTIDYHGCAEAGVEVLSCSPGFREAVAEMGLAMLLAGARGLVDEHEAFRHGNERWLQDRTETDFSLYRSTVGFVGFGQISQEMTRLLAPFGTKIVATDPWLPQEVADQFGVGLLPLEDLAGSCRAIVVAAVPTQDNHHLINAELLTRMPDQTLVILLSRAHLLDLDAMLAEVVSGRLRFVTDVFPEEPLPVDHPVRQMPNVILSPHRAAAVEAGRHLIGDMILDDLCAMLDADDARRLARANPTKVGNMAGIGDAKKDGVISRQT